MALVYNFVGDEVCAVLAQGRIVSCDSHIRFAGSYETRIVSNIGEAFRTAKAVKENVHVQNETVDICTDIHATTLVALPLVRFPSAFRATLRKSICLNTDFASLYLRFVAGKVLKAHRLCKADCGCSSPRTDSSGKEFLTSVLLEMEGGGDLNTLRQELEIKNVRGDDRIRGRKRRTRGGINARGMARKLWNDYVQEDEGGEVESFEVRKRSKKQRRIGCVLSARGNTHKKQVHQREERLT